MKFYTISSSYAAYLKQFDNKVPNLTADNYKHPKPFIGVVLQIENHAYLAPMTSPKDWHTSIKGSDPKYFKIYENGNTQNYLGMINLKFMIPVLDSEISLIDLENIASKHYQRLLYNQLQFIRSHQKKIKSKSLLLRKLVLNGKINNTCNFQSLEANYMSYALKN